MPTFTSPVTVADLQTYLRDVSTDTTLLGFYQTLLDTATESVYTWLDRDYTALATKTDRFWGDDTEFYAPHYPAGSFVSWSYIDMNGFVTSLDISDLLIRANGYLVQAKTKRFVSGAEHAITYKQPATLVCPETVKQVIVEIAAQLFDESNQGAGTRGLLLATSNDGISTDRERFLDLSERHKEMLRPYKRYPV